MQAANDPSQLDLFSVGFGVWRCTNRS